VRPVATKLVQTTKINSIANLFKLKAGALQNNWKHWYEDLDMIGRHFLVYSNEHITVKRQYTICNSIEPRLYKALLEVCDRKLASSKIDFDRGLLKTGDTDSIYVTAKDYHTKRGVVT